jgi:hypothetical protein
MCLGGRHKWTQFAQWTKIIKYMLITSLEELTLCCMFMWLHFSSSFELRRLMDFENFRIVVTGVSTWKV